MRIDFYLLAQEQPQARYPYACRVIDKAYQRGHHVYVHTSSEAEAHIIDDLLWTFRDDSFIPHEIIAEDNNKVAVTIGFQQPKLEKKDILINLSTTTPTFASEFQRLIEIVPQDAEFKALCREHYRAYSQQGHDINTHNVK